MLVLAWSLKITTYAYFQDLKELWDTIQILRKSMIHPQIQAEKLQVFM